MPFKIISKDALSSARAGILQTDHGDIQTPIFMPVGTLGTVKATEQRELENDIKAQIILGNTYHLYLRPGMDIIQKAGGLHKFINWNRPILTDSGGYQVYSLSKQRKITEEGVFFSSHIDGSRHFFTPESIMNTERQIGADIMMAFDECPPYPCDYNYAKNSMDLTHRWLKRCIVEFDSREHLYGHIQILAPIVQGSIYEDLRKSSAEFVSEQNRELNAIGGLSVGEPHEMMYKVTELVCSILPSDKPRYLMGVGTPENILESIALGIDMFDCVMPTRNARHGLLYTENGIINIKNAKWKDDFSPVDESLDCYLSNTHTKAYLNHLFRAKEILGLQIASVHNLTFYLFLVKEARKHIVEGDFSVWKEKMVGKLTTRI
jgi:queuine tRNA-ribosyltransferase